MSSVADPPIRPEPEPAVMGGPEVAWRAPDLAATLLVLGWTLTVGLVAVSLHDGFRTAAFDLGIFAQGLWRIGHGLPPYSSAEGVHLLGDHAALILYPLGFLYRLAPDPRALVGAQAFLLALGAGPIYLLARRRGEPWLGVAIAAAYLANPSTLNMALFDFHPDALGATALLVALAAALEGRLALLAGAALVVAACKESFSLTIAGLGVTLLLRRRPRSGALLVVAGAAWFVFATSWLLPAYNRLGGPFHLMRYGALGRSVPEVVTTVLTKPGLALEVLKKNRTGSYAARLLVPFLGLPLLAPAVAAAAGPAVAMNALSSFGEQRTPLFQYQALVVPILTVAALAGVLGLVGRFPARRRAILAGATLALTLGTAQAVRSTPLRLADGLRRLATDDPRREVYVSMLGRVPGDANVSVQSRFQPHLANRRQAYVFPQPFLPWNLLDPAGAPEPPRIDVILFDRTGPDDGHGPLRERLALLDELARRGLYRLEAETSGVVLLTRVDGFPSTCYGPGWNAPSCEGAPR